jgi:GTPase
MKKELSVGQFVAVNPDGYDEYRPFNGIIVKLNVIHNGVKFVIVQDVNNKEIICHAEQLTIHDIQIGSVVNVNPLEDDDFHEFTGTVINIKNFGGRFGYTVKDQDDNHFDCELGQVILPIEGKFNVKLTYGDLLEYLQKMPKENLKLDVSIYSRSEDEFYELNGITTVDCGNEGDGILDDNHPYLITN